VASTIGRDPMRAGATIGAPSGPGACMCHTWALVFPPVAERAAGSEIQAMPTIREIMTGQAPRELVTVRVANRFFCGTLLSRTDDEATILVDTPQGGVTAMTGPEVNR
jgi:hypothetical protein